MVGGDASRRMERVRTEVIIIIEKPIYVVRQLRWLMDHPEERRRMGERAAAKAREQFSDDAMARKTIAVYEELLC